MREGGAYYRGGKGKGKGKANIYMIYMKANFIPIKSDIDTLLLELIN